MLSIATNCQRHYTANCCYAFIIIVLLLTASSCTVQKRYSMNGYHVEWHHIGKRFIKQRPERIKSLTVLTSTAPVFQPIAQNFKVAASPVTIRQSHHLTSPRILNKVVSGNNSDLAPCDTLVNHKNEKLPAHVIEISPSEIRYKRCDNPDGPIIIASRSEFRFIYYANGVIDTISPSRDNKPIINGGVPHKEFNTMAGLSFGFGAGGITLFYLAPLGALLGIIFGIVALIQIRNSPDKYKGVGYAYAGIVCGTLILLLTALIIAAAIGFF